MPAPRSPSPAGTAAKLAAAALACLALAAQPTPAAAGPDPALVLESIPTTDVWCVRPMQVRNSSTAPKTATVQRTYQESGPGTGTQPCATTPRVTVEQHPLAAGAVQPLGCTQYASPSTWCPYTQGFVLK